MGKQNVKRSKALTQQVLEMIKEGYDAETIAKTLGYANASAVRNTARKYGLKVAPAFKNRDEEIVHMRGEGMSYNQISNALGLSFAYVSKVVKNAGLKDVDLKVETETRYCEECGKEFVAPSYSNQKYCSEECEKKASRRRARNIADADDSCVQPMLDKLHPEFEYVGGYAGSESRVDVKCKKCGTVTNVSYTTVRKKRKMICPHCDQEERERARQIREAEEKEKSRIQRIVRQFNKPVKKTEQIQAKTCPECGAFYFSTKPICKDCTIARQKRVANRKKELKKKNSRTEETKLISARTLYKRDGGVCWICGGMCDINADPNSDLYPSVDHIIPQSLGGKDTLDNVRLAHRICNTRRSNRTDFKNLQTFLIPPVS